MISLRSRAAGASTHAGVARRLNEDAAPTRTRRPRGRGAHEDAAPTLGSPTHIVAGSTNR